MSRHVRQRARKAVLLLAAVLLVLAHVPCVAWANQTSATIVAKVRVFQEYKVEVSGLQTTFEYVIEPVEKGAPMPVDADGNTFSSFSLKREADLWLEFPVKVTMDPSATPYVYHYMIKPKQTKLAGGLYYVDVLSTDLSAGINEYPLEIHVQPSSVDAAVSIVVPTVHMEEFDGPKVADPGWRVAYKKTSDTPSDEPGDNPGSGQTQTKTQTASAASPANVYSGGGATNVSVGPLSVTSDQLVAGLVATSIACVGALSLACASLLRRKAGGDDA